MTELGITRSHVRPEKATENASTAVLPKEAKPKIENDRTLPKESRPDRIKEDASTALSGVHKEIDPKNAADDREKYGKKGGSYRDVKNSDESDASEQNDQSDVSESENPVKGLTDEEILKIKEETGWSDAIADHIESMEQYEIYKNAGLHETEINGRKCLIKDIDMDYVDPKTGMANRERLAHKPRPLSPIDAKTGEKIELHHMGQDFNGPFAELCENSEHGDGNHSVLHNVNSESWRRDLEKKKEYQNQKDAHWSARAPEA